MIGTFVLLAVGCGDKNEQIIKKLEAELEGKTGRFFNAYGMAGRDLYFYGDVIEKEAVSKGPIGVGEAVATTSGALGAKYIIHAAGMGQDLQTSGEIVEACTAASLRLADELGVASVARGDVALG